MPVNELAYRLIESPKAVPGTDCDFVWRPSVNLNLLTRRGLLLRRQIRPRLCLNTEPHHLINIKIQQILRRTLPHPNPVSLLRLDVPRGIKNHSRRRHKDIIKEAHSDSDTHIRGRQDATHADFAFERAEDNHAEIDIDVHDAGAVADEAFGGTKDVIEGYAEADAVDDFVGVFGVDVVFDCLCGALFEVLG